jgi:hypothetical protein
MPIFLPCYASHLLGGTQEGEALTGHARITGDK